MDKPKDFVVRAIINVNGDEDAAESDKVTIRAVESRDAVKQAIAHFAKKWKIKDQDDIEIVTIGTG